MGSEDKLVLSVTRRGRLRHCYFVGAMYPVTREVIPDTGDVLVQVIVGSWLGPVNPGVANRTVPSA